MSEYIDLVAEINSYVPQVLEPVAIQQIRKAVREFCKTTEYLKIESSPKLDMVAGQPSYQVADPAGTNIVRVLEVWDDDEKLHHKSSDQFDREVNDSNASRTIIFSTKSLAEVSTFFGDPWESQEGEPRYFFSERPSTFRLVPIPETSKTALLKVVVSVQPSRTSTGVDDFIIDNWYESIIDGALAYLYEIPKQVWTDKVLMRMYRDKFDLSMGKAHADRVAGFEDNDHVVGRTRAYP